jgi:hypothetical protein
MLRTLHDVWLAALVALKWNPGENDDEYKARVAKPYAAFVERAMLVRAALSAGKVKAKAANTAATPVPPKSPN